MGALSIGGMVALLWLAATGLGLISRLQSRRQKSMQQKSVFVRESFHQRRYCIVYANHFFWNLGWSRPTLPCTFAGKLRRWPHGRSFVHARRVK
jgi:hypothetical protein